jgi:uncharacterized protein YndB with AHSA1/START domain
MSRVRVSTVIDASRAEVWDAVRDIGSHVRWMHDAEAIRFTSGRREGTGTTFDCDSRLGPFRLVDHMEVVEWQPGRVIGIRHVGTVTGVGRFTLRRHRRGTRFVWKEKLRFPWWMGGPVAGVITAPFFRRMWRKNLRNLKALVEGSAAG